MYSLLRKSGKQLFVPFICSTSKSKLAKRVCHLANLTSPGISLVRTFLKAQEFVLRRHFLFTKWISNLLIQFHATFTSFSIVEYFCSIGFQVPDANWTICSVSSFLCLRMPPHPRLLSSVSTILREFSSETYKIGSVFTFALIFWTALVCASDHSGGFFLIFDLVEFYLAHSLGRSY